MFLLLSDLQNMLKDKIVICLCALVFIAGSPASQAEPSYEKNEALVAKGHSRQIAALRQSFWAREDVLSRLRSTEVIARTLRNQLISQPISGSHRGIRSINTADSVENKKYQALNESHLGLVRKLLEENYSDLLGHNLLQDHYLAQGENQQARIHQRVVKTTLALIENAAKRQVGRGQIGSTENNPVPVLTPAEAYAYARLIGLQVLGGIYVSRSTEELRLVLTLRESVDKPHRQMYFSLDESWQSLKHRITPDQLSNTDNQGKKPAEPSTLIAILAKLGDPAAQNTVGASLSADTNRPHDAVAWLQEASTNDDLTGTLLLAELYHRQSDKKDGVSRRFLLEQAQSLYLKTIARGSDTAMVQLGLLYLSGAFGEEKKLLGLPFLEQARSFNNTDAMIILAQIYSTDLQLQTSDGSGRPLYDLKAASQLLRQAGQLGSQSARLAYGEFQLNHNKDLEFDPKAYQWLKALATKMTDIEATPDSELAAEAMLLLGWINARGLTSRKRFNAAKSWWRRAAKKSDNPRIINEVAYLFVAITEPALRDAALALRLMDKLMIQDLASRNHHAYLDTWASAYADNGQFERAVDIQKTAIDVAQKINTKTASAELVVLREHLEAFQRGEVIRDVSLD